MEILKKELYSEYESFCLAHPKGAFQQSVNWAKVKKDWLHEVVVSRDENGAIVGGVSASGGSGTILGAFLGVIVICLMRVGLPFVGLQSDWQQIFTGLVLIAAVLVDILKNKKVK